MIEFPQAKKVAVMLAAVGEPTRLLLLQHLVHGPHHVGQLAKLVNIAMVNASHHLSVMRQAGLIDHVKEGRRVVYSLRSEVFTPGDGGELLGTIDCAGYKLVLVSPVGSAPRSAPPKAAKKNGGR
jgi:DNA-binding transcriptional ArsR family regulator